MYKIFYLSPEGDFIDLTSADTPYMLKEGGVQGLVGQTTDITTPNSRSGGNKFNGIAVNSMTGSLKILITEEGSKDGKNINELFHDLRTYFSRTRAGRLVISDEEGFGEHYCTVRLASNISAPERDPHDKTRTTAEVEISLVCDDGVWIRRREYSSGNIKVINDGDLPLYPIFKVKTGSLQYQVTMPSGVKFYLPSTAFYEGSENFYFHTDPQTSYKVTDDNGELYVELWKEATSRVVGEPVMPFGEETFIANGTGDNLSLIAEIKVLDPWR